MSSLSTADSPLEDVPHLGEHHRSPYATFSCRLGAYILDVLIAFTVLVGVGIALRILRAVGVWVPATTGMSPEENWYALGFLSKLFVVFAFVVSTGPFYGILFEASPWQATFGKRLLNIYVAGDDGKRISIRRALGRWLARWVFGWFGGTFISGLTIISARNRKALHDFAANTVVVRGRPMPGGALEPWRVAAAFGIPFVWIIGTFLATM